MAKKIGDTLRESRISAGISVEQISDILTQKGYKASIKTIYSWENGNSSPGPDALLEMCDIYKIGDILSTFGYDGYKEDGSLKLNLKESQIIEKYRSLDPHGQQTVDLILDRELVRSTQAKEASETIEQLQQQLTHSIPSRFFAYYGRIAAAGKSYGFEDMICGTIEVPLTEENQYADFAIGVSGNSMEPDFTGEDIVYVQKTDHLNKDEIGIFQKDNCIYIKKVGDGVLLSINPDYNPIPGNDVKVLGKVLGKIAGDYKIIK